MNRLEEIEQHVEKQLNQGADRLTILYQCLAGSLDYEADLMSVKLMNLNEWDLLRLLQEINLTQDERYQILVHVFEALRQDHFSKEAFVRLCQNICISVANTYQSICETESSLYFRRMRSSDILACTQLFMQAFKGEPWQENWTYENAWRHLREIWLSPYACGFVGIENSEIVALALGKYMTYLEELRFCLDEFSVSPSKQGQHIGQQFMDYIKEEMAQNGTHAVQLWTKQNFPCASFYQKRGFTIDEGSVVMTCQIKK